MENPFKKPSITTYDVKGAGPGALGEVAQTKKTERQDLEEYEQKAQELLDSYRNFFLTFAKDVSVRFEVAGNFMIDLYSGTVYLDAKWFKEKGFTSEQVVWAALHELSHFLDLTQDPKGMRGNVDNLRPQIAQIGAVIMAKYEEEFGQTDPELIENLKKRSPVRPGKPGPGFNATEATAARIFHDFYNGLDDIFANDLVARNAPHYSESGEGGAEVYRLYSEKLFPQTDMTESPRHLQFIDALLRGEMVADQELTLDPLVEQSLQQPIRYKGILGTPREIVQRHLKPKSGEANTASRRYTLIRNTLQPVFIRLLLKDLEEWKPPKPKEQQPGQQGGQGGEGKQGAQDGQDGGSLSMPGGGMRKRQPNKATAKTPMAAFGQEYGERSENEMDRFSEEDLDRIAEIIRTAQEAPKQAVTSSGASKFELRPPEVLPKEQHDGFRKMESVISPHLDTLARLWQHIVYGSSRAVEHGMVGPYKTGTELDIPQVIQEYPRIAKGHLEDVRVMKRMESKETLVKRPELIRVRLLCDMSGSMMSEPSKLENLRLSAALMLSSLREFNTYLNLTRGQTKSKLYADTQVLMFGNRCIEAKPFRGPHGDPGREYDQIVFATNSLNYINIQGSTFDDQAFQVILASLDAKSREKIKNQKIMEIVIEITDGGSSSEASTKQAVTELLATGAIVRAFQIGKTMPYEQQIFDGIWNQNPTKPLGEKLKSIGQLPAAMAKLLREHLGKVRL